MRRAVGFVAAGLLTLAACSPDQAPTAPGKISGIDPTLDLTVPNASMPGEVAAHVTLIRGMSQGNAGGGRGRPSPNLVNHGGPILTSTAVKAIFWGTSWNTSPGDKISGMDTFYSGIGGSGYMGTNTEYTSFNGQVGSGASYLGHVVDDASGITRAPSTSQILAEVCSQIPTPVSNGYYPVYTDLPRGSAGYCAWHSAGTCGSTPVQFAFFFKLDGDAGCNPGSNVSGESQGLAALANVSGHELSEAVTDPQLNAWYDNGGAENADKCAWTFGLAYVTFSNGSHWKIQGNWSNAAYNARSGYDGAGCIQGS